LAHLGKKLSAAHRAKLRAALFKRSKASRAAHAAKMRGRKFSRQHRQRISAGRTHYLISQTTFKQTAMSKLEKAVAKIAEPLGYVYVGCDVVGRERCQARAEIPAALTPDFVHKKRVLLWIDGCYFHECPKHGSGRFIEKRESDRNMLSRARMLGFHAHRLWECRFKRMTTAAVRKWLSDLLK
jgi:G:T-mismatch repair DNA endonuclease (very short patch repair protein)